MGVGSRMGDVEACIDEEGGAADEADASNTCDVHRR